MREIARGYRSSAHVSPSAVAKQLDECLDAIDRLESRLDKQPTSRIIEDIEAKAKKMIARIDKVLGL